MSGSDEEEEAELDERGMHLGDVFADDDTSEEPGAESMADPDDAEQETDAQASPTADPATEPAETAGTTEADAPAELDDTTASDTSTASDPEVDAADAATEASGQASKIVRESQNLNIYVSEDLYERVQRTYKELDSEYYATHGEDLEKNREFYTALLTAGLESGELRERLGIE